MTRVFQTLPGYNCGLLNGLCAQLLFAMARKEKSYEITNSNK